MNKKFESHYSKEIGELDPYEKNELRRKVHHSPNLDPWLIHFIERFHQLAEGTSKKSISKMCKQNSTLLNNRRDLPTSTLSDITNPKSDKLRAPSINNLISLSEYFGVSIDYLVGKTDCIHPEYEKIHQFSGLSDEAIDCLILKKRLFNKPICTRVCDSLPLDEDGLLDVSRLSQTPNEPSKNSLYQYEKNGNIKEVEQEKIILAINKLIEKFPAIIPSDREIKCEDSPKIIEEKINEFETYCPNEYYFQALNKLITYKNGYLINLLGNYLYKRDLNVSTEYISSGHNDFMKGYKNPFRNESTSNPNLPPETLYLLAIQTELTKLHEECK